MKKIILATGILFAILFSSGFKSVEYDCKSKESQTIPEEKKALLSKIVGRWITQTNIYARDGQAGSKVIGSDV